MVYNGFIGIPILVALLCWIPYYCKFHHNKSKIIIWFIHYFFMYIKWTHPLKPINLVPMVRTKSVNNYMIYILILFSTPANSLNLKPIKCFNYWPKMRKYYSNKISRMILSSTNINLNSSKKYDIYFQLKRMDI